MRTLICLIVRVCCYLVNFSLFMCAISIWWWKTPRSWSWQYSVYAKHGNDGDISTLMPNNVCPFVWQRISAPHSIVHHTSSKYFGINEFVFVFIFRICDKHLMSILFRVFSTLNVSFCYSFCCCNAAVVVVVIGRAQMRQRIFSIWANFKYLMLLC